MKPNMMNLKSSFHCKPLVKSFALVVMVLGFLNGFGQANTSIKFYAHPGFDYFNNPELKTSSPYFRGGPLVLFATSQINDRVSVAGEINLHYNTATGPEIELERMYLKYSWKDALSFSVGRMYSPIGFWNSNYNFGLVLQPNISRPKILNPTHDGGFIQTRDIGLQLEGENLSSARFFYKFLIGNGIGKNGGLSGTPYALGKSLAYTLQLGVEPVDGLRISVSGVMNKLPNGSATQFDNNPVTEDVTTTVISGSISNMSIERKFEFIAEYFRNAHDYASMGEKVLGGGIVYAGYKLTPKIIPYVFAEFLDFPSNDPYYPLVNIYTDQSFVNSKEYNLGFRYKASANLVLKIEASYVNQDVYGESYGTKTQVAFAF
jgi:hypothetical protein